MTFIQAYQNLLQTFATDNNLDLEDDLWPAEYQQRFNEAFKALQKAYGRKPL